MSKTDKTKMHEDRTDLLGEHKLGDSLQLIAFFVFLGIWITDSFVFRFTTSFLPVIPLVVRIVVSVLFLVSGFAAARSGMKIVFGEVREKPEIIQKGVFGMVRHPVYLGAILLYPGLFVLTLSVASFVFWLFIVVMYNWIAKYEESLLLDYFGDDYRAYMKKAGRWCPKLWGTASKKIS